MRRLLPLALLLSASALALPVSVTFYTPTGHAPACRLPRAPAQPLAVSRDLLPTYPCGTRLRLSLSRPAGGRTVIVGVVVDTTGPRARQTVDVQVSSTAQARRYGRISGTARRAR